MNRAIWKYVVPIGKPVTHMTPRWEFIPMLVGTDPESGLPAFWASVSPDGVMIERTFEVVATGQPFGEDRRQLGSVIQGPFVWHLLEVLSPLEAAA